MNTESMYTALGITPAVHRFGEEVLAGLRARFDEIDRVAEYNQCKVIGAMQKLFPFPNKPVYPIPP